MSKIILTVLLIFSVAPLAQASGKLFMGGTQSAVLIYSKNLNAPTKDLIFGELLKQFKLGKIKTMGEVSDPEGDPVICAQFGALDTYDTSFELMNSASLKSGARENSVVSIGSCLFDL